ncbi:bifunctional Ankyrin repeat/Ankyrin repeat-containing domain superfamily [Babesia duncani]|uniref:Bifunctional Ankyrin repeat/Ankyrin repeat-containing domain superfamily n=1 Tax=Babesia duncani TaxID=323732 RepID=A0AAD9PLD2_9APIC|nr:bifunctional Ankyrin repeat/Ankyrin repeat-containing domain superfamily [Babesia duncani]
MGDFFAIKHAVDDVMSCCFGGTLEQLKAAVQKLLSVDSPELKEQFEHDISKQKNAGNSKDEVIFTCLELSALESLKDSQGHTVAHVAAAGGNLNVLQSLITASPSLAHMTDNNGETPLFYAIRAAEGMLDAIKTESKNPASNHVDCLLLLLGHCGPNSTSNTGASALHVAAELGDLAICRILLDNNANANIYTEYGTPLTISVIRGYTDITKLLLNHGCNPDATPSDGSQNTSNFPPPLVFASSAGKVDLVQMLLQKGANVNIGDAEGWTGLHCAAEYGHLDIVKLLVDNGADCSIKIQGKTAYDLAVENSNANVAEFLSNKRSN